jgi:hypothetical protein
VKKRAAAIDFGPDPTEDLPGGRLNDPDYSEYLDLLSGGFINPLGESSS